MSLWPTIHQVAKFTRLRRVQELRRIVEKSEQLREIAWPTPRSYTGPAEKYGTRKSHLDGSVAQIRN